MSDWLSVLLRSHTFQCVRLTWLCTRLDGNPVPARLDPTLHCQVTLPDCGNERNQWGRKPPSLELLSSIQDLYRCFPQSLQTRPRRSSLIHLHIPYSKSGGIFWVKMAVLWDVSPYYKSGRYWPTFQRSLLPPSSTRWVMMEAVSYSETSVSTRLYGATSQKTAIFIFVAVRTWKLR
jgi:hypothetical protein